MCVAERTLVSTPTEGREPHSRWTHRVGETPGSHLALERPPGHDQPLDSVIPHDLRTCGVVWWPVRIQEAVGAASFLR